MATIKQSKLSDSARKARNRLRKALSSHLKGTTESRADQARRLGVSASTVSHLRKNTRKKELSIDELITLLERAGLLAKVSVKKPSRKRKKAGKDKKPGGKTSGKSKSSKKKSVKKKSTKKKTVKKKTASKKASKKKVSRKKTAKKTGAAKKTARKVSKKKRVQRKPARKTSARKKVVRKKTARKTGAKTLFKAPAGRGDNLQRIKGVGPGMEKTLNRLGITTYRQIARFKATDVTRVADAIGSFGGRVKSDNWVRQAGVLAGGGETAFSKRVDKGTVASSRRTR